MRAAAGLSATTSRSGASLPQSVTNQVNNAPLSKQDTQTLLNYLLAP